MEKYSSITPAVIVLLPTYPSVTPLLPLTWDLNLLIATTTEDL